MNCKSHIKELPKKALQKIAALSRLSNYLNDSEKKLVFNSSLVIVLLFECYVPEPPTV